MEFSQEVFKQRFRIYVHDDLAKIDAMIQEELTTLIGWKIVQMDIITSVQPMCAWALWEIQGIR